MKILLTIVVLLITVTVFSIIATIFGISAGVQRPIAILLGLGAAAVAYRFTK